MFDEATIQLIAQAAPLSDLDLALLPQLLTEAYAQVVAARLGALDDDQQVTEWSATTARLQRLAETYEGLAIFMEPGEPHRASCAFVAASAHFTLNQARRIEAAAGLQTSRSASLTTHGVSPEVASCLLFLIAEQQADAGEASKTFVAEDGSSVAQLLDGIRALASGEGRELARFASLALTEEFGTQDDYLEQAARALWLQLTRALQLVARCALGDQIDDPVVRILDVARRIENASAGVPIGDANAAQRLPLEGPYHLARLLGSATAKLLDSCVVITPAPDGVPSHRWVAFLKYFAAERPFLWRNHLLAIQRGFLGSGTSFVLTFPTGAGKTTITALRIAVEVLRGRAVVYLVPTRALVDQVAKDLTTLLKTVAPDAVRGRFTEDYGETSGGAVYVQTPEQCLAYLSHDNEAHENVGLLVVDECHQLSAKPTDGAEQGPLDRRAVDAMWTVIRLLDRSPSADAVLISAMVKNGPEVAKWIESVTRRPATLLDLPWKPTRQVRGVVAYAESELSALRNELSRRRSTAKRPNPGKRDKQDVAAKPVGLFCHSQVWDTVSSFAAFPLLPKSVDLGVNAYWKMTANRNQVAGQLMAAMAQSGMRPIVFSQVIDWTPSIANVGAEILRASGVSPTLPDAYEARLFSAAGEELGRDDLVVRPVDGLVGVHHGQLLLAERLAVEASFRRKGGIVALVATPTIAQGINLPAEAVIIAGDDRWEGGPDDGGAETLAVHELLNAAGRAGRAGHFAHGIVVDVPSKVFSFGHRGKTIEFDGLDHVMSLFGSSDQCIEIVDPLTQAMDRILDQDLDDDVAQYVVRRCGGIENARLKGLILSSFGVALNKDREAIAQRYADEISRSALALEAGDPESEGWRELASNLGTSVTTLLSVARALPAPTQLAAMTPRELLELVRDAVLGYAGIIFDLVDPHSSALSRIISRSRKGADVESMEDWSERCRAALVNVCDGWLGGEVLFKLGETLRAHRGSNESSMSVKLGRRFAIHTASALGHAGAIVCKVIERHLKDDYSPVIDSLLPLVSGCLREGFDDPDKLLLFWCLRSEHLGLYPRVLVHRLYPSLGPGMPSWETQPDSDVRRRLLRRRITALAL